MTYWGEFYSTVLQCEDCTSQEQKQFEIFFELNNAKTLKEVRKILKKFPLTEEEVNRLNSRCLDGILVSAKYKRPLQILIRSYPQYIETCRYYLDKNMVKRSLIMACSQGRKQIVELLLEKGADMHAKKDEALSRACSHIEIVQLLLDKGIDIRARTHALIHASHLGTIATVKLLLKNGADPRANHNKALYTACVRGNIKIAQLLIENGAEFRFQHNCLLTAIKNGTIKAVKFLLEHTDNIHVENDKYLYEASVRGYTEIVTLLLERGASIENNHFQCLYGASVNRHNEVVEILKRHIVQN